MSDFKAGDLLRVTRPLQTNWGWNFQPGDMFHINRPGDLVYFDLFGENVHNYFERVDVETYGRHHTDYSSTWGHATKFCVCWVRKSPMPKSYDDYHGKHRIENCIGIRLRYIGDKTFAIGPR